MNVGKPQTHCLGGPVVREQAITMQGVNRWESTGLWQPKEGAHDPTPLQGQGRFPRGGEYYCETPRKSRNPPGEQELGEECTRQRLGTSPSRSVNWFDVVKA